MKLFIYFCNMSVNLAIFSLKLINAMTDKTMELTTAPKGQDMGKLGPRRVKVFNIG